MKDGDDGWMFGTAKNDRYNHECVRMAYNAYNIYMLCLLCAMYSMFMRHDIIIFSWHNGAGALTNLSRYASHMYK